MPGAVYSLYTPTQRHLKMKPGTSVLLLRDGWFAIIASVYKPLRTSRVRTEERVLWFSAEELSRYYKEKEISRRDFYGR